MATRKPDLSPSGNKLRSFGGEKRKTENSLNSPEKFNKATRNFPEKPSAAETAIVQSNAAAGISSDSSDSSDSSSSSSSSVRANVESGNLTGACRITSSNGTVKTVKIAPNAIGARMLCPTVPIPVKRCDWITPNSEPLYTVFHDEEWGVPVHDDIKLFELLVLSQALSELSWPVILSKRAVFRMLFHDFDPKSIANLDVETLKKGKGSTLLSLTKLDAIRENANQLLKVQQEFDSFSNYCWRFTNHKPIRNSFRFTHQIPAKTPKSKLISNDLMQRGFLCVGPTVVYSFMQAAGIANNHLVSCFRYSERSQGNSRALTRQEKHKKDKHMIL